MSKIVAYYRTRQSNAANFELEVQRQSVQDYAHDARCTITAEFIENAGSKEQTPELMKALTACSASKAKLVVARLDCLPCNLVFVTSVLLFGIECLALDQLPKEGSAIRSLSTIAEYWR